MPLIKIRSGPKGPKIGTLTGTISGPAGSPGNKDLEQAFQPLFLATFTFPLSIAQSAMTPPPAPTVLYLSTHPLNVAEGGFQFNGNDYQARLLDQNIDAIQAMSDTGIDIPPTLTLEIADADRQIWTYYEMAIGFKGATLEIDLVLWEADTNSYSDDFYCKFIGTCDPANIGEKTLTVSASSKLNMQKILLPIIPVQTRCPWIFPPDAASRLAGFSDPSSPFYPCGYSPDVPGGFGNGLFTTCDYSRVSCDQRGMFNKDSSGNVTGHFGGVEWDPPLWWKGITFTTGNTSSGVNPDPSARYSAFVPLIYGMVFLDGVVLNIIGSSNTTTGEVLVCFGDIGNGDPSGTPLTGNGQTGQTGTGSTGGVQLVIINGVLVPYNFNSVRAGNTMGISGGEPGPLPIDANFIWAYVNWGQRYSVANYGNNYSATAGVPFTGLGDPYGNLAVINFTVPTELGVSGSIPEVRILALGPACRAWYPSDPGGGIVDPAVDAVQPGFFYLNAAGAAFPLPPGFAMPVSANGTGAVDSPAQGNPIVVLMDLLIRANWSYYQLDINSFFNAAVVCQQQISYTNNSGAMTTVNNDGTPHLRYSCSLAVTKRRTAADVIQGVRNLCKAMLVPNSQNGLLQVFIKQTLADQQSAALYPAGIPGSNSADPITGLTGTGGSGVGYSAYDFDETSILADDNGDSTLRITQRRVVDSPNSISSTFPDQDNSFVTDSITELDPVDVARAGQTVIGGVVADGLNNFDQSQRIFEGRFAETFRGNPRADSGGTLVFQFQTTQKVAHLVVGQICRFSHQQLALVLQPVRLIAIQPSRDHETASVTLQWHEDFWYVDTYGQQGVPIYSGNNKSPLARPPFAWQPFTIAPFAGDSIFDPTDFFFAAGYTYGSDANGNPLITLSVAGVSPVNSFGTVQSPLIERQGETIGGSLVGGLQLFAVVCAYGMPPAGATGDDSSNLLAPPQIIPCMVQTGPPTTSGAGAYGFEIRASSWPPGAAGWYLFAGPNHLQMTLQMTGSGTPATISFSGNPTVGTGSNTSSALNICTAAPPDVNFYQLLVQAKLQLHGGVWGDQVDKVTATTLFFGGAMWDGDQWKGYDVSCTCAYENYVKLGFAQPILNFRVASNTQDTLTLMDLSGGAIAFDLIKTFGIAIGDVFVMRAKPDTFTAFTIGDSNFVNQTTPGQPTTTMGLTPNEGKNVLRIFAGTGVGQWRNIVSNTATVYTVATPFNPIPDPTSRFWIESPAWIYSSTTLPLPNAALYDANSGQNAAFPTPPALSAGSLMATVPIANYNGESVVIQAITVDSSGNQCLEQYAPIMDLYIFGIGNPNAFTETDKVTFGLETDTVGTNLVQKYGAVHFAGQPYTGSIVCVNPPVHRDMILDVLYSHDNGVTFNSIFPPGNPDAVPPTSGGTTYKTSDSGLIFLTEFAPAIQLSVGDLLRIDGLQQGGATGITMVVKWGVPTTPTPPAS